MKAITFSTVLLSAMFISACQRTQAVDYVKFKDAGAVPRVSVEDAKKEVDAGNAIIIDSRAEAAYKMEHIAGALSLPHGSLEERFKELPAGKKLIIYCSCAAEQTSLMLAMHMNQTGVA